MPPVDQHDIGFIAIGRNEGARLIRCLRSLRAASARVVYVDSGSSDDSAGAAKALDVEIVTLGEDQPFTAARARNAGFERLTARWPQTKLVMFIDGDCELIGGFAEAAAALLGERADLGIVTGRCRERNRNASVYNLVCDMEWDGPVGEIAACGGIFMTRTALFQAVSGFNPAIVAAEDDDFCVRIRQTGSGVYRLDDDMCWHDADMRRFGQWWRRAVRAGHAYGQLGDVHDGYFAAERRRAWIWGLAIPAAAFGLAPASQGASLMLFLLYPLSFIRTAWNLKKQGATMHDAIIHSAFLTISKIPNLIGIIKYRVRRLAGRDVAILEYK